MADLAPGRAQDIAMLVRKRSEARKYSHDYYKAQRKIEDLVEEGKCNTVCSLRGRLIKASVARDDVEIEKISRQIEEHVRNKHPRRFYRAWSKG